MLKPSPFSGLTEPLTGIQHVAIWNHSRLHKWRAQRTTSVAVNVRNTHRDLVTAQIHHCRWVYREQMSILSMFCTGKALYSPIHTPKSRHSPQLLSPLSWQSCEQLPWQRAHLVAGVIAENSSFLPDVVGIKTLLFGVGRDEEGVVLPVRQGEALARLYTQRSHLAKQVTERERKICVFIHGNTPEMQLQPKSTELFRRKAAASCNLAPGLMQIHVLKIGEHKGR